MTSPRDPRTAMVDAAMDLAADITAGRLDPATLEAEAVEECRRTFARVAGPGDPYWGLQVEVARQVLAVGGGIGADELAEWVAVYRAADAMADDDDEGDRR